MHTDALTFIGALRAGVDDDLWSHIWRMPEERTIWFQHTDGLLDDLVGTDIYIGGGLTRNPQGVKRRLRHEIVDGLVGLWSDIDYAHAAHKKSEVLAKNPAAALRIINDFPLAPSIIVNSGHGYQCWWLFKEAWAFTTPEERDEALNLSGRWNVTLRSIAERHGATIDSVYDLTRLMRLPGTLNGKTEPAVPVTIIDLNDVRYEPGEIAEYALAWENPKPLADVSLSQFGPDIAPPPDKLLALMANSSEFADTFYHRRKMRDPSLSSYDMSLANIAAQAGWDDNEIAGLLVAHRKHHGGEQKHRGYYTLTIAKARSSVREVATATTMAELESTTDRDAILTAFSQIIGVEVSGLTKYGVDDPIYVLHTAGRSVTIGPAENVVNATAFRTKLLVAAGILPPPIRPRDWAQAITSLMRAAEHVDTGIDVTEDGSLVDLLTDYLRQKPPLPGDINEAVVTQMPVVCDGAIHIPTRPFQRWLKEMGDESKRGNSLASLLAKIGCTPQTLYYTRADGVRTSTTMRRLPPEQFDPADFLAQSATL